MPGNLEGRLIAEGLLGESGGYSQMDSAIKTGVMFRQPDTGPLKNIVSPSWDRKRVFEWLEDFGEDYDNTTLWNETNIQGTTTFTLLDNNANGYNGVLSITTSAVGSDGGQIQWNREKVFGPHLTLGGDFWFHARIALISDPEYVVRVGMMDENANTMGTVEGVYFDIGADAGSHDVDCEIRTASGLTSVTNNAHLLLNDTDIKNKWLDLWIHWDPTDAQVRFFIGANAILAGTYDWTAGALASVVPTVSIRTVTAQASAVLVDFIHIMQERAGFGLTEAS
jgi:hypothetical protein